MQDPPTIDLTAIRDRHPQHFARFDRQRLLTILTGLAAFALLLFGMAQLGFFGGRCSPEACACSKSSG